MKLNFLIIYYSFNLKLVHFNLFILLLIKSNQIEEEEAATASADLFPLLKQTDEHILLQNLFNNYEPSARPVQNHTKSIKLYLRLRLSQVLDLSEKEQSLTTNMWIEQVI